MIDFNHSVPQKASTAVLKAQILISGRLICFPVVFKITSINQDLAILAEKITNAPAVFPNRMSATVKIVIVFLQNCYCLSFFSLIVLPSLSASVRALTLSQLPKAPQCCPLWDEDAHKYIHKSMRRQGNIIRQLSVASYPSCWGSLSLREVTKRLGHGEESGGTYSSIKFIPGLP